MSHSAEIRQFVVLHKPTSYYFNLIVRDENVDEVEEGLIAYPKCARLWIKVADYYRGKNMLAECHDTARRAFINLPHDRDIVEAYAMSLFDMGKDCLARQEHEEARAYFDDTEKMLFVLADIEGPEHWIFKRMLDVYETAGEQELSQTCARAITPPYDHDAIAILVERKAFVSLQHMIIKAANHAAQPA